MEKTFEYAVERELERESCGSSIPPMCSPTAQGKAACDPLQQIRQRLFNQVNRLEIQQTQTKHIIQDFEDPTVQKVLRVLAAAGII